jgi:hypothetical protein
MSTIEWNLLDQAYAPDIADMFSLKHLHWRVFEAGAAMLLTLRHWPTVMQHLLGRLGGVEVTPWMKGQGGVRSQESGPRLLQWSGVQ